MELTTPTSHRADQLSDLAVIKIKAPNLTLHLWMTHRKSTSVTPPSPSAHRWD
jgi:hypothetical protein